MAAAPIPVNCPYCNARLRLPEGSYGKSSRIKCRACKNSFRPAIVLGATAPPPDAPLPIPAAPLGGFPAAPAASESANFPVAPALAAAAPAEAAAHPAEPAHPEPVGVVAEAPVEEAEPVRTRSLSERREAARHRLRQKQKQPLPLRPYEAGLAVALVLGLVGGIGAVVWRLHRTDAPAHAQAAEEPAERPSSLDEGSRPVSTILDPPEPVPVAPAPPKPLPRRLFGTWELRADDPRTGRMDFRADGTMTAEATVASAMLPEFNGSWVLVEEKGDRMVLELGQDAAGLGGHRITLIMTSPNAFTLVESIYRSVTHRETQRFIRATPPPPAAPGERAPGP